MLQKAISESDFFKKGVYDRLEILEIFGEPWFPKTREDHVMKILEEPEDFVERDKEWVSQNLNEYREIYIRVGGKGSLFCHHVPRGVEHNHHGIYFVVERRGMFSATLIQHCFSNEFLYDRKPCKATKPPKHTQWACFQPLGIHKYSPESHDLFVSLFGNIDDGSDRLSKKKKPGDTTHDVNNDDTTNVNNDNTNED